MCGIKPATRNTCMNDKIKWDFIIFGFDLPKSIFRKMEMSKNVFF